MTITKAIIPVAGWGTRRLPITKTIEKCMLPIGNRPLVDYVVQDCLKAGITELIFVVGEGSTQLEDYYRSNIKLNDYLRRNGKEDKLPLVAPLQDIRLHFVVQPSHGKYGTAVPVALASEYIEPGESAVVLMGDDFIWNQDDSSEVARLIESTPEGSCSLLAARVPKEDISSYGVIETDEQGNFVRSVEKPSPEEAPSDLINISKYVLTREVIDACRELPASPRGEYELPEAVNNFVSAGGQVRVVPAVGQYLDGGSVEGWLHANNVVLKKG
jgi:UTP--glucose-1-phosphate uridylyltransferase